jgi:hypothetical protein
MSDEEGTTHTGQGARGPGSTEPTVTLVTRGADARGTPLGEQGQQGGEQRVSEQQTGTRETSDSEHRVEQGGELDPTSAPSDGPEEGEDFADEEQQEENKIVATRYKRRVTTKARRQQKRAGYGA